MPWPKLMLYTLALLASSCATKRIVKPHSYTPTEGGLLGATTKDPFPGALTKGYMCYLPEDIEPILESCTK
jgi:hypothetical protein